MGRRSRLVPRCGVHWRAELPGRRQQDTSMAAQGEDASDTRLSVEHLHSATRREMLSTQRQECVDASDVGERQTTQVDAHHADVSAPSEGPVAQQLGAEEVELTMHPQEQAGWHRLDVEAKGALVSLEQSVPSHHTPLPEARLEGAAARSHRAPLLTSQSDLDLTT